MVKIFNKEVGDVGYGLMGLSWRATPPPREQSIAAMKAAYDSGAYLWNGGDFYGDENFNSNHLLVEYFTKYPEHADKVVLCIKGAMDMAKHGPDSSEAGIDKSINNTIKLLNGKKKLDLFECARVDPNVPIEDAMKSLQKHIDAGNLGGISLSEVGSDTIRRAAKVAKIYAVEVEFSMFATDILDNGIAKTCAELDIPIVAYSPIGRGFLTGEFKKPEDIPKDDIKANLPKYQGEAFYNNIKLVHETEAIAKKKGVTPAQVAIAWVKAQSGRNGLGTIIPIPGASKDTRVQENCKDVKLTEEELKEIDEILAKFQTIGERYGGPLAKLMNG